MAVPSTILDLSTAAASNSPAGSETVGPNLDNYIRSIEAIVRQESENKSWERWGHTPTYISASSFSVTGDQTAVYLVGRRLKATVSGSPLYGNIASASFGAGITTVTVTLDSGALTAGLTEVQLGLELLGTGLPNETKGADIASASTVNIGASSGRYLNITGSVTITAFDTVQAGTRRILHFTGAPLVTHNATSLILPAGVNFQAAADDILVFESEGGGNWRCVGYQKANGQPIAFKQIQTIDATVSANALTVTINPTELDFRSATLTSGTINTRFLNAATSLTVASGATLGTVSGQAARLVILAIDNAGTIEPAIVNLAGGVNLDETGVISTTALSGSSNSANVVYSTTARTNVPYRVVGFIDITETIAGTWATAPSTKQGAGGQALAALSSYGFGQTLQDLTGSRSLSTTYYNTTGRPFKVYILASTSAVGALIQANLNGTLISQVATSTSGFTISTSFDVPPGSNYSVAGTNATISKWFEVR